MNTGNHPREIRIGDIVRVDTEVFYDWWLTTQTDDVGILPERGEVWNVIEGEVVCYRDGNQSSWVPIEFVRRISE